MSNKPKRFERLVPYNPTAGEIYHQNLVNNSKNHKRIYGAYSSKHVGSKRMATLAANCNRTTLDNMQ